jgi:nitrogen fixation NifU-like protein
MSVKDTLALYESVHGMLTGESQEPPEQLGKLAALAGVREFPSRVKCASLGWHALKAGLTGENADISTE